MKFQNLFYILIFLLGFGLLYFYKSGQKEILSFYGFAESKETEINYNYPVVVDQLFITPGQEVKQGDLLIKLKRVKAKETMSDESFRIAELKAEAKIWKQKKNDDLLQKQQAKQHELTEISVKIAEVEKELAHKINLVEGLSSIDIPASTYNPIKEELEALRIQKQQISSKYDLSIAAIQNELALGMHPYSKQSSRLAAEAAFAEANKIQEINVTAPTDGIVGNIYCKEAEHIPSFKTLITFYEPHSSLIKGYVHEDLTLKVSLGKEFKISSLTNDTINYQGKVIGLGSRIVEIPSRLRKMEEIKTYGREVLLSISKENSFLQKEKVAISNGYSY